MSKDEEDCRQQFLLETMEKRRNTQKVVATLEHYLEDKVNEKSRIVSCVFVVIFTIILYVVFFFLACLLLLSCYH